MWTKLVALFLLFAIVSYDPVIARKCKDGQSYYDGCNSCFCASGALGCTVKYCGEVTKLPPPESFWE
ncbi:serine protease inhibitor 3-like [Lasioglossum baleicum]|uniref:serine protease inhibitor 3-like n=1 Tax=Lasioglossum baleicum TaxID=434251 RepID=UPI003FCE9096